MTFTVAAGADDGTVRKSDSSYPPSGSATPGTGVGKDGPGRLFVISVYEIEVALMRWDTSALPDNATITGATLRVYVSAINNDNVRQLTADWYTSWPIDEADYSETAQTGAINGTNLSSLTAGQYNDITLSGAAANVSLNGYTGLRFHISGGSPTGINNVQFALYENALGVNPPQLIVTYSVPSGYQMML